MHSSESHTQRPVIPKEPCPDWGHACLVAGLRRLRTRYALDPRRGAFAVAAGLGGVCAGGHLSEQLVLDSVVSEALLLWPGADLQRVRAVERAASSGLRKGARTPKHPGPLRASGRQAVAEQLLEWETTARGRAWTGRSGAGRLALLLAMYRTASKVGRLTLSESLRELQAAAGHSSTSVTQRSLSALEQAGWLRRLERGSRQATQGRSLWELLPPPAVKAGDQSGCGLSEPAVSSEQSESVTGWLDPAHDCWHQRQTAWRVAAWLAEHPGSCVSDVAHALRLDRGTARAHLRWLVAESLAVATDVGGRERRTYAVAPGVELAAARSAESWSESPAQVRQRRHQQERERWHGYLSALADMRERDRLQRAWEQSQVAEPPPAELAGIRCAYDAPATTTASEQAKAGAA
jgi:hypothetical protein